MSLFKNHSFCLTFCSGSSLLSILWPKIEELSINSKKLLCKILKFHFLCGICPLSMLSSYSKFIFPSCGTVVFDLAFFFSEHQKDTQLADRLHWNLRSWSLRTTLNSSQAIFVWQVPSVLCIWRKNNHDTQKYLQLLLQILGRILWILPFARSAWKLRNYYDSWSCLFPLPTSLWQIREELSKLRKSFLHKLHRDTEWLVAWRFHLCDNISFWGSQILKSPS